MTWRTMIATVIAVGTVLAAAPVSAGGLHFDITPGLRADRPSVPLVPVWGRDWDQSGPRDWRWRGERRHNRWHDDDWRGGYRHRPYPSFYFRPYGWNRWDANPGITFRFGGSRWYEDDCRVVRVKFRSHGRWVVSRRLVCRD